MDAEARKEMEDLKVGFDLRPSAQVYNSYKEYQRAQNQASRSVTIGRFIAFFVDWTGVPVHKRQKFWLGKVTDISETTVTVHYYHTAKDMTVTTSVHSLNLGRGRVRKSQSGVIR